VSIRNALTVDVEDYFHVSAFEKIVSRDEWASMPSRIEGSVDRVLGAFDDAGAKGTFFVLGWVCEHYPNLVRRIHEGGHEIASHSCLHERIRDLDRETFRNDVVVSKKRLEDTIGEQVIGYRAPSFSLGLDTPWAHEELARAGYAYSSSVYPILHDHYGIPDAPRHRYTPQDAEIVEIPMSTFQLFGRNLPCSGGGYFRLLPLAYSKWAVRRINNKENKPAVFYFHPWEMDPEQPRIDGIPLRARFRHYVNLSRFETRLRAMLKQFSWDRADRVFLEAR
jgi:polysaccharide deacetylase family protein (PEP-CTERM system associated)